MNQCELILKFIKENGGITSQEAMLELGVYRLASRINDLTNQGYVFDRKTIQAPNRYGEMTHFTRYSLAGEL